MNELIYYHAKQGLEKEIKKTNKRIKELTEKLNILECSNGIKISIANTRTILAAECKEIVRIEKALEELENEQKYNLLERDGK
jgi:uncharacterized protein (DUF2164 family)